MTVIQALAHFLDITFAKVLEKGKFDMNLLSQISSPAYETKMYLMGRTLAQSSQLYGNIQMQNPTTTKTLTLFLKEATELYEIIQKKDIQRFEKFFNKSKKYLGNFATKALTESDALFQTLAQRNVTQTQYAQIFKKKLKSEAFQNPHNKENIRGLRQEVIEKPIPQGTQKTTTKNKISKKTVGILGPEYTFSHIAFEKFNTHHKLNRIHHCYPTIQTLFKAYKEGKIKEAFVPLENKLHGSVPESLDGIIQAKVPIQALFEMRITPSLFTTKDTKIHQIQRIYSHSQPLAQCSHYLEKNFKNAEIISTCSTIAAVEMMSKTQYSAAIAAPQIAEIFDVREQASDIANDAQNATRFAFLSKDTTFTGTHREGAIVFSFAKDSPGSLATVLQDFSAEGINLTKIESRPIGNTFGDYLFFVQFLKGLTKKQEQTFLPLLRKKTSFFFFLGNFPLFESQ